MFIPIPTIPRPKNAGAATRVDVLCSHHQKPGAPELDREQLYWELSLLTRGVTQLGNYTLDQNSLYVNGEQGPLCSPWLPLPASSPPPSPPGTCSLSSLWPSAGYTHRTTVTTPSGE